MNKIVVLIYCVLNFTCFQKGYACTCDWQGAFLKMANDSEITARVKVVEHLNKIETYDDSIPKQMIVEVLEVLKGSEDRKLIKIWGGIGMSCRPYLSIFSIGSEWILNLEIYDRRQIEKQNIEYSINKCGETFLKVVNKKLQGILFPENESLIKKGGKEIWKYKTQKISLAAFRRELYKTE